MLCVFWGLLVPWCMSGGQMTTSGVSLCLQLCLRQCLLLLTIAYCRLAGSRTSQGSSVSKAHLITEALGLQMSDLCLAFAWVLGIQTPVIRLVWQALCLLKYPLGLTRRFSF